ncbi:phosphotransferase family protein [Oceanobacillus sp. CFH 90083]|uniref:phosphotransferase family protein n=1 Tax=Oceanobacillus sp. CFH 90083 TaxID=2592336 RepID=UPI00188484F4|nr:aminoglycoside phosphotransferase family protein [Oceanobacillus sp. CFH 90083]
MKQQLLQQKLDIVKAELGQLSYQNLEFITTGCEKDVIIFDKKTVISFFRDGLQIDNYRLRQDLIHILRKQTEFFLPECLYISPTQDFVVEKYVPGYHITPHYIKTHMEKTQCLGTAVGRFLRQLHTTAKQGLDLPQGIFAQDVWKDMKENLNLLRTKLSDAEMNQVNDFLDEYYSISASIQQCVVHGDFHYDNIFWDESTGHFGAIDFSEAGLEDPALDFMYMCYYPEAFRNAVFEEYDSKDSSLYERSQMYDRIYGLYDMIENLQNNLRKPDFRTGYSRFFKKG